MTVSEKLEEFAKEHTGLVEQISSEHLLVRFIYEEQEGAIAKESGLRVLGRHVLVYRQNYDEPNYLADEKALEMLEKLVALRKHLAQYQE